VGGKLAKERAEKIDARNKEYRRWLAILFALINIGLVLSMVASLIGIGWALWTGGDVLALVLGFLLYTAGAVVTNRLSKWVDNPDLKVGDTAEL